MYRITKQFEISHYLSILTRDGMLYFLVYVHSLPFDSSLFPCYHANDELLLTASHYLPSSLC